MYIHIYIYMICSYCLPWLRFRALSSMKSERCTPHIFVQMEDQAFMHRSFGMFAIGWRSFLPHLCHGTVTAPYCSVTEFIPYCSRSVLLPKYKSYKIYETLIIVFIDITKYNLICLILFGQKKTKTNDIFKLVFCYIYKYNNSYFVLVVFFCILRIMFFG